jgi:hypothetical protein
VIVIALTRSGGNKTVVTVAPTTAPTPTTPATAETPTADTATTTGGETPPLGGGTPTLGGGTPTPNGGGGKPVTKPTGSVKPVPTPPKPAADSPQCVFARQKNDPVMLKKYCTK